MWTYDPTQQQAPAIDGNGMSRFPIEFRDGAKSFTFSIDLPRPTRAAVREAIQAKLDSVNVVADVAATPIDLSEATTPNPKDVAQRKHAEALALVALLKQTQAAGVDVTADLAEVTKKVAAAYTDAKPFLGVTAAVVEG